MYKKLKFIIDTIVIACIPEFKIVVDNIINHTIVSSIVAAAIAVVVIIALEKIGMKLEGRVSGLEGVWYEYILSTPERPFSVCRIKRNIFSGEVNFYGTNYAKELNSDTTVDFSSTHLWFIDNGFIYISKGDAINSDREKYSLGKYIFSNDRNNGLIVAKGFFIDTTDSNPQIKDVIMYKANRKFYEKLGLEYRKRNHITTGEVMSKLPKLIKGDVKKFNITEIMEAVG